MGYSYGSRYDEWAPYVSVAERKEMAANHVKSMKKKGKTLNPVVIEGKIITKTFWGKAWCKNLETYSDYESRLPRGRTYVRNGSVIDLNITIGQVQAEVMGSSLYKVVIQVKPIPESKWKALIKTCAGKIESLIELLQGKFSKAVMGIITEENSGLFPSPKEISMRCSCPDSARMCKHIAAVLYGVGASLDLKPEGLFALRHVDHVDLIASASTSETLMQNQVSENMLQDDELSALFGIEMDVGTAPTKEALPKKVLKQPTTRKSKAKSNDVDLADVEKKPSKKSSKTKKTAQVTKVASKTKTKATRAKKTSDLT